MRSAIIAFVLSLALASQAQAQQFVQMVSDQLEPTLHGASATVTPSTGAWVIQLRSDGVLSLQVVPPPGSANTYWTFGFQAPTGQTLAPGSYHGAQFVNAMAPGHPGINVFANTGTCINPLQQAGNFNILELQVASDGSTILKLAVDFDRECDGTSYAIYGGLRYNSSIAYTPPILAPFPQSIVQVTPDTIYVATGQTAPGLQAKVLDQYSNPIAGATVMFWPYTGNGTLAGSLAITELTDANGIATSPPFYAPPEPGPTIVYARLLNGPGPNPQFFVTFQATGPNQLTMSPVPAATMTVHAGDHFQVGARATYQGNVVSNVQATVSVTGSVAPASIGTQTAVDSHGNMVVDAVAGNQGGTYTVVIDADGATTSVVVTQVAAPGPTVIPGVSFTTQDMWWNPSQNGWGMSLVQHDDTLFGALYIYDRDGKPTWVVMPGGTWDSTHTVYSGAVFKPTGTPFYAYDAQAMRVGTAVGSISITFQDANNAVLDYTIAGVTGRKLVSREVFASGDASTPNRSDLWWGGAAQNGWGITVLQQASTLFAVWYTYDANGSPVWYVMPGGSWTAANTYEGALYRTTSSAWAESAYDASKLQAINAGSFKFQFTGDGATFTYSADGHAGSIPLVKEPF
jgi:hypothetical protein